MNDFKKYLSPTETIVSEEVKETAWITPEYTREGYLTKYFVVYGVLDEAVYEKDPIKFDALMSLYSKCVYDDDDDDDEENPINEKNVAQRHVHVRKEMVEKLVKASKPKHVTERVLRLA